MNGCKEENKYSWKIVKRSDWRLVENDKKQNYSKGGGGGGDRNRRRRKDGDGSGRRRRYGRITKRKDGIRITKRKNKKQQQYYKFKSKKHKIHWIRECDRSINKWNNFGAFNWAESWKIAKQTGYAPECLGYPH